MAEAEHPVSQQRLVEIADELVSAGGSGGSEVFRMGRINRRLLEASMDRPGFRTALFRLVDVLPVTDDPDDVLSHITEYLGPDAPALIGSGITAANRVPGGARISAAMARRNVAAMARQFIIGTTPTEAATELTTLWRNGAGHSVDLLGEKTLSTGEADRYAARVVALIDAVADQARNWMANDLLESDRHGALPRVQVSVKPTALSTHLDPLGHGRSLAGVKERIRPILRHARQRDAFINFDMEDRSVRDAIIQLFCELLAEDEFIDLPAGIAIQAYLVDSAADLRRLIDFSASRPVPISVRLVKGAYWDTETIHADAAGWPRPTFSVKAHSDANFEACARLLLDHHQSIRVVVGTHNLRSLAYVIAYAETIGLGPGDYEMQMLYGMAEPMHAAARVAGHRLRVYAPVGELIAGMAYLVRRLLENTSNESFVRMRFAERRELDNLLVEPEPAPAVELDRRDRPATDDRDPAPYSPEPLREWRRAPVRSRFSGVIATASTASPADVPLFVAGAERMTSDRIDSADPARPDRVVARSASASESDVDQALAAAEAAAPGWRALGPARRAAALFAAAHDLRRRRDETAATIVIEAGKPWDQADADVCEAIDFCEYYGRGALRLAEGGQVESPPGERNTLGYRPKGVAAVIGPWNFPLAIPTGMTVAALVAGNPVILKPAEQTPSAAWALVSALRAAGVPDGVIQFLPGRGEIVGAALVADPRTAVVAFTGSMEVGLQIIAEAAVHRPGQRHVKRVVAEMGGKNALIVDGDADLDQAVPGAVQSAFGYSGQKCSAASRLIVHQRCYDEFVARFAAQVAELVVGPPMDMATQVGPVIDGDAREKIERGVAASRGRGQVVAERTDLPAKGFFVGPTVFAGLDRDAPVACEEMFGPVVSIHRAADLDEAISLANDTDYALTAGIYGRLPSHIEQAAAGLRAGNIYVNRPTTGAVVGRQPFGGFGLSGVGSKAGGPDYLLQFMDPVAVSENTVRQGFGPESR